MTERNTTGPLVMFDLDGTLIDSVGGIAHAVNAVRQGYGLAPLATERVKSYVGNGARKLAEIVAKVVNPDVVIPQGGPFPWMN